MPYSPKTKKNRRRRPYKKKGKRAKTMKVVAMPPQMVYKPNLQGRQSGLPLSRTVTLRYVTRIGIAAVVGNAINFYRFRANSIWQPDYTNNPAYNPHQPFGRDLYSNLYRKYIVKSSKIRVEISPGGGMGGMVGVHLESDAITAPYVNATSYIEAKKGTWITLNPRAGAAPFPNIGCAFSAKKFFNITDIKDNFAEYGALQAANPNEEAFFNIYQQNFDSTASTTNYLVTIDYTVIYGDPIDQLPS